MWSVLLVDCFSCLGRITQKQPGRIAPTLVEGSSRKTEETQLVVLVFQRTPSLIVRNWGWCRWQVEWWEQSSLCLHVSPLRCTGDIHHCRPGFNDPTHMLVQSKWFHPLPLQPSICCLIGKERDKADDKDGRGCRLPYLWSTHGASIDCVICQGFTLWPKDFTAMAI